MPQIWMTYAELAALLGLDTDQARALTTYRSLDRKKSRDGVTRVKLDPDWTALLLAAIRQSPPPLDEAICDLRAIGREMAEDRGTIVELARIAGPR